MCELRGDLNASLAPRHNGQLPLQRLRPLPQDERDKPTSGETQELKGFLLQTGRDGVRQLQHGDNDAVATNGGRRHCVQRLRTLPEDPQPASADHVEERQCADKEEKAEQGGAPALLIPSAVSLLGEDGGHDDGVGPRQLHLLRLVLLLLKRLLVPVPAELNGSCLVSCLVLLPVLFGQPCIANICNHRLLLNLSKNGKQSYDLLLLLHLKVTAVISVVYISTVNTS